jgi:hypothetical protein
MLEILALGIESLLFTGIIIKGLHELSGLNMARQPVRIFQQTPCNQSIRSSIRSFSEHQSNAIIFDASYSGSFERGTR